MIILYDLLILITTLNKEINNPNSLINTNIYNTDSGNVDSFSFLWTEDNNGCTDSDIVEVIFARIPDS